MVLDKSTRPDIKSGAAMWPLNFSMMTMGKWLPKLFLDNNKCWILLTGESDTHRTSSSLLREVRMMCKGSSPYVIPVLGVFKGHSPSSGPVKLGLVMEFMERGSLANLQVNNIPGPLR